MQPRPGAAPGKGQRIIFWFATRVSFKGCRLALIEVDFIELQRRLIYINVSRLIGQ